MSKWNGGVIRSTQITPGGSDETAAASGVWRASDAAYWVRQGQWPTSATLDPYFPYNTLLLNGNGLHNARNNALADSSSVYSPITRYGNATQGSFTPYGSNWSNYFDGSTSYLTVSAQTAMSFGTGDFTIEGWVNPTTIVGVYAAIIEARTGAVAQTYAVGLRNSGGVYKVELYTGTQYTGSITVNPNVWTHFAITRASGTLRIFVNGVLDTTWSNITTSIDANVGTQQIGRLLDSGGAYYFPGYISNLHVVKGTALYTANYTPPTAPLTAVANTSLLTCAHNRFRDSSTNNFAITPNGSVTVTEFSPFSITSRGSSPLGYYNQDNIPSWSNYFDGTGDNLSISSFSSSMSLGTGDFTIELWVYPTTGPNNNWSPFMTIGNSGGGQEIRLSQNINGTGWGWLYPNNSNNADSYTGYGTLPINQWHHIAMVRSGTTLYLFRNGTQVATATSISFNHTNTTLFRVAMPQTAYADGTFNGYISNLRIVKGTALYTSAFTPPTSQLTAVSGTVMLTCQSPALTDRSSLAQTFTVNGDVVPVGFSPFNGTGNYSAFFDGSGDYGRIASSQAALQFGTGDFTVEGWVYSTGSTGSYQHIITGGSSWTTNSGGVYWYYNGGSPYIGAAWNHVSPNPAVQSGTLAINRWHHFALVRSGNTLTLYVNGTSVSTLNVTGVSLAVNNQSQTNIGGGGWDQDFAGFISNIRVLKGTALYTSNFTVPTTQLSVITNTSLLTLQDNRFLDNSTNAFTIATTGDIKTQTFNPFTAPAALTSTGSVYLDGSGDFLTAPHQNVAGSWTLEFWWYPTNGVSSQQTLVSFNNGSYQGINIWCNGSAQLVVDDGATGQTAFSTTTFRANQWNHVAIVRNGSTTTGYINGVAAGSNSFTPQTVGFISVGRYNSSPFYYAYGYISDLRFVNGTVVYSSAFTPPTAPVLPTPNTTFKLDGLNAAIADLTSTNNLETGGTARVNTSIKKYGTGSIYFDGSSWLYSPSKPENYFGTGNFTIEGWFYFLNAATNVDNGMFGNYLTGWGSSTIYLGKHTTYGGKVALWVANYSTGGAMLADPNLPPANTWVHYAVVRNGNTWTMYRDGTSVASQSYSGDPMTTKGEYVVGRADATAQYFYGYIDEFRISKYARYTSNFTPSTSALPTR